MRKGLKRIGTLLLAVTLILTSMVFPQISAEASTETAYFRVLDDSVFTHATPGTQYQVALDNVRYNKDLKKYQHFLYQNEDNRYSSIQASSGSGEAMLLSDTANWYAETTSSNGFFLLLYKDGSGSHYLKMNWNGGVWTTLTTTTDKNDATKWFTFNGKIRTDDGSRPVYLAKSHGDNKYELDTYQQVDDDYKYDYTLQLMKLSPTVVTYHYTTAGKTETQTTTSDKITLRDESGEGVVWTSFEWKRSDNSYLYKPGQTIKVSGGNIDLYEKATYITYPFKITQYLEQENGKLWVFNETTTYINLAATYTEYSSVIDGYVKPDPVTYHCSSPSDNFSLKIVYKRDKYNVIMHTNLGDEDTTPATTENGDTFSEGTKIACRWGASCSLPTLKREGYKFLGWSTNADDNGGWNSVYVGKADVDVYAIWVKLTSTSYTVIHTYKGLDDTGSDDHVNTVTITEDVYAGQEVTAPIVSMEGFVDPEPQKATISADGSTVFEYTYERKNVRFLFKQILRQKHRSRLQDCMDQKSNCLRTLTLKLDIHLMIGRTVVEKKYSHHTP